jgi:GcrA cell cycle regulator
MPAEPWTDERIEMLHALWANGETAQSIADRLAVSRSAVMGKIFRLRLDGGAAAAKSAIAQDVTAPTASIAVRTPVRRRRSKRPPAAPKPIGAALRRGKSLLELTTTCCRWPHGEPGTPRFFFCGAPGADLERGMPYCARHARRAYLVCNAPGKAANPTPLPIEESPPLSPQAATPRRYVWRASVRHPAPRWR